jgi:NAD(P)-dependent dehydrogenase (short-subunit alcohol dehydrogenase family)
MLSTLIAGANRGFGLEFARQYVADGRQVYPESKRRHSVVKLVTKKQ